ncbi:hypothetical protein LCGC14_1030560 [marine sediment metagenome]|uniref:Uncharacterized protein n=1 Tax=marine sediment metagenome TaxID=412755 RepID=A0A0F9NGF6_9ZZZZ
MTPDEVRERYIERFSKSVRGVFLEGVAIRLEHCNQVHPFCCVVALIHNDATAIKDRRIAELEAALRGFAPGMYDDDPPCRSPTIWDEQQARQLADTHPPPEASNEPT